MIKVLTVGFWKQFRFGGIWAKDDVCFYSFCPKATLRNYAASAALIIAELVTVKCAFFAIFIL